MSFLEWGVRMTPKQEIPQHVVTLGDTQKFVAMGFDTQIDAHIVWYKNLDVDRSWCEEYETGVILPVEEENVLYLEVGDKKIHILKLLQKIMKLPYAIGKNEDFRTQIQEHR